MKKHSTNVEDYIRYHDKKLEIFDGDGKVVIDAGPISLNGNLVRRWSITDGEEYVVYGPIHERGPTFQINMLTGDVRTRWTSVVVVPKKLLPQFCEIVEAAIKDWFPLTEKYCTAFPSPDEIWQQELLDLPATTCQHFVRWLAGSKHRDTIAFYKEWRNK